MADPAGERLLRTVWRELGEVDGFMEGASVFSEDDGDRAYFIDGTQVAHFTPDGRLELRLTRAVISKHRARLKDDARVELRRSGSDWLTVEVGAKDDRELVLQLAGLASAAHWPESGALHPPPEGADLARRRRFH